MYSDGWLSLSRLLRRLGSAVGIQDEHAFSLPTVPQRTRKSGAPMFVRAVEGRVEVDEVYRLVLDVLAQDFEIVAVIELVFLHCGKILTRIGGLRNCSSGCVAGMPGGVIVERTDAGSLDSVAASLREPATALGMTG